MSARYAIGIDLGTTNTALCAASLDGDTAPEPFSLAQVKAAHEVVSQPLLPSFHYQPASSELPDGALDLPWVSGQAFSVGAFAKDKSATVPGRVIASAKSWLVHPGVDRKAAILPFGAGADDDVTKLSPVTVQARVLAHLRQAWDHAHPEAPLAEQRVVLTVPASFDAVARALTEDAAREAGLPNDVVLLEEPQAALYAWIASHDDTSPAPSAIPWRKQVQPGDVLLVVDVGGGTTDFSLIEVKDDGGNLSLERKAVGDHILLGGDNMDLALAYGVKQRLADDGREIDDWQLRALVHSCRAAKEALLEDDALAEQTVVIPGRGSKLIGGSIKADLARAHLEQTVVDGFFPHVDLDARPQHNKRAGLQTLGLPYAHDAGITRHLAAFVREQLPTAVLFNGGVAKSGALRARIMALLTSWSAASGKPTPRELQGAELDLAVATGAAAYARVRANNKGLRIKGGTSRAYYVGIEKSELAVPGLPPRTDAVCIAPKGMEEGSEASLSVELGLVTGEPATFRFFSSLTRDGDAVGASFDADRALGKPDAPGDLTELAAIETTLEGSSDALVPVTLRSRVTEVGALELLAVEVGSGAVHKLSFQIREQ